MPKLAGDEPSGTSGLRWIMVYARACRPPSILDIPGFRVIDCLAEAVVTPPSDCEYVALSYVWGPAKPAAGAAGPAATGSAFGLNTPPRIVKDAMSVTRGLGFQYLWVDRYCIDQNDENKHLQITRMDIIYSLAVVTIIDAVGGDSDHGLVGTERRPRPALPRCEVAGTALVHLPAHPAHALQKSPWANRAWTYQECYLSSRRLIFTQRQVSYLCNCMHVCESVKQTHESMVNTGIDPFLPDIPNLGPSVFDAEAHLYSSFDHFFAAKQCIKTLTARKLSYQSDALNACLGILHSFNQRNTWGYEKEILHIWDPPVWIGKKYNWRENGERSWKDPRDIVHIQLGWHHDAPTVRREGFPSGSWAGCEGPALQTDDILNFGEFNVVCETASPPDVDEEPPFRQNVLRSELQRSKSLRSLRLTPRIVIQGPVVSLEFRVLPADDAEVLSGTTKVRRDPPGVLWRNYKTMFEGRPGLPCTMTRKSGLHCYFELNDDIAVLVPVYLDTPFPTEEVSQIVGLVVGMGDSDDDEDVEQRVLVVKYRGGVL